MLLDVGRHFYPVPFLKHVIDAMALLKMNTLHWHLTEDQVGCYRGRGVRIWEGGGADQRERVLPKLVIDAIALLKVNTFHWRLTEDHVGPLCMGQGFIGRGERGGGVKGGCCAEIQVTD